MEVALFFALFWIGLSVAVIVHELGHLFAARVCGIVPKVFSVFVGPTLPKCKWKIGGTVFKVCWLPLGGYVQLPHDPLCFPGLDAPHPALRIPIKIVYYILCIPVLPLMYLMRAEPTEQKGEPDRTVGQIHPLAEVWIFAAGPLVNIICGYLVVVALIFAVTDRSLTDAFVTTNELIGSVVSALVPTKEMAKALIVPPQGNVEAAQSLASSLAGKNLSPVKVGVLLFAGTNLLLALFNLLPLPGLDGYHIVVAIVRGVFGKRVYDFVRGWLCLLGAAFIGWVFTWVILLDILWVLRTLYKMFF